MVNNSLVIRICNLDLLNEFWLRVRFALRVKDLYWSVTLIFIVVVLLFRNPHNLDIFSGGYKHEIITLQTITWVFMLPKNLKPARVLQVSSISKCSISEFCSQKTGKTLENSSSLLQLLSVCTLQSSSFLNWLVFSCLCGICRSALFLDWFVRWLRNILAVCSSSCSYGRWRTCCGISINGADYNLSGWLSFKNRSRLLLILFLFLRRLVNFVDSYLVVLLIL